MILNYAVVTCGFKKKKKKNPSLAMNTKNVLIATSFIHLKHKKHAKYTLELTTVNPRILLSGPAGKWSFLFNEI
jgi:hypothetical protein